jgi:hypothetical protein
MDDDFRELEPEISDHPFQPGTWPDARGYVDEHGWTCGCSRGGAHPHQRRGIHSPIRIRVGWAMVGRAAGGATCWPE